MDTERAEVLKSEVAFVRDQECIGAITRVRALLERESADPEMLRLMTVPILYSVWERAFSSWTAISLKVVEESVATAQDCPPATRAFWLRKADFFKSFLDSMRDVLELSREDSINHQVAGLKKASKKGTFNLSGEVLAQLDHWHAAPLTTRFDHKDLVVTYSNVNDSVVRTNAEALGLHALETYAELDLSELSRLVGIRNGIGHGASLSPPGPRAVMELVDYTERLVKQYADITIEWIGKHTA